ncbi:hypothetical protein NPIL_166141 [Nephila pilipes]|uniref:Uncharacterized protein n=1 Tax=Nephila pilipes TaxID=299642 RepID=A0A8X6QCH1_NEPPI|nr:hypothetical protein NPIL_492261 [Nephila pilipes]GFU14206.1 hypothetical protein NPIL_166141 [Nephila pilipes]
MNLATVWKIPQNPGYIYLITPFRESKLETPNLNSAHPPNKNQSLRPVGRWRCEGHLIDWEGMNAGSERTGETLLLGSALHRGKCKNALRLKGCKKTIGLTLDWIRQ